MPKELKMWRKASKSRVKQKWKYKETENLRRNQTNAANENLLKSIERQI